MQRNVHEWQPDGPGGPAAWAAYVIADLVGRYPSETIADGGSMWRSLLDSYRIDMLLADTNSPITSLVKMAPEWVMIDSDKEYALFARRR